MAQIWIHTSLYFPGPVTSPASPSAPSRAKKAKVQSRSACSACSACSASSACVTLAGAWVRGQGLRRGAKGAKGAKGALKAAAPGGPLELTSEFDAEDPELRVEAANQVGAGNVVSTLWPPKRQLLDTAEMTPIKQETTVGRFTGSAPPFPAWPFYEARDVNVLQEGDPELDTYQVVDFGSASAGLTRAFALASRWQKSSLGRSAGFARLGAGVLSSFKFTNPILIRELQGLHVLQDWRRDQGEGEADKEISPASFSAFVADVGASDLITKEFRAVAPVERETFVTGLVSTTGSALAIWTKEKENLDVQICLGHDCLDQGPIAEERLLRLLAGRAAEMQLPLRCRGRFTEKGKLIIPCSALGFQLAPGQEEFPIDTSDEDALSNPDFTKPKDWEDVPEAVPGLHTWLLLLCLEERIKLANEWCEEQGAATLEEVIESREDLADFLAERGRLTPGERQALLERDR